MLSNRVKKNFDRTILRDRNIFAYEEQVTVTAGNLGPNDTRYKLETRLNSADMFMDIDESYLLVSHGLVLLNNPLPQLLCLNYI